MYYIWERNDGYINATAGRMPQDYKTTKGDTISFKLILQLVEWNQDKVESAIAEWKASK